MAWGELDDEAIEDAQRLVGTRMRRDNMWWIRTITEDAILHYAWGIGDPNPLWRDPEYGPGTRWGTTLAPPTILYACDTTTVAPRLPGVQWLYAATDWTWYDVVRLGDRIRTEVTYVDCKVKSGRFSNRWVLQTGRVDYIRRSDDKLIATAYGKTARTPRGAALKREGRSKYKTREPYPYTPDEIEQIEKDILAEWPVGSATRFWEDVEVGEVLPTVVKGPLTSTDLVAYYAGFEGSRGFGGAHYDMLKYRQRHDDYHISEITGAKDSAGRGHMETTAGNDVGMGGAYDLGPQRVSWAGHLVTNWMSDDGFLRRLNIRVERPNLFGDTTWFRATVTGRSMTDEGAAVELAIHGDNQFGEVTTRGTATVLLPSTEHGPVQLPLLPQ